MNYSKSEIVEMLGSTNFDNIYRQADEMRQHKVGDGIQIRALLEFSNYCRRNCSYCGLNCKNKTVTRFRLTPDEIVSLAHNAYCASYKTIVLQSGEDSHFTTDMLGEIVKRIKSDDIMITLSCGELSNESYTYLKDCGADRYLLKHETADPDIYASLHQGYTLKSHIDSLKAINACGLQTGSGFMIGLPNQTLDTIADDILLLKEIGCHMAGIGPFIPHGETPLSALPSGSVELTMRAVALARLVLEDAHLPATTSLGVIDMDKKRSIFSCGANVIMQKITPNNVKRLYEIYPSSLQDLSIEQGRINVEQEILSLGRIPV